MGGVFILAALATLAMSQLFAATDLSFNITVTFLDSGTIAPSYNEYFEDDANPTNPPGGWWDVDNANIRADGLGSAKVVVTNAGLKPYGMVASNNDLTLDFSDNHYLRVIITQTDSVGNIIVLQEYSGGTPVGSPKEIARNLGEGIHDGIDINTTNPWSGTKTFAIQITIESTTSNLGTRFDEITLYNGDTTAYSEDFEETTVLEPPGGWWQTVNSRMTTSGTGSARIETVATNPVYCEVESNNNLTLNFDAHHFLSVVVRDIDTVPYTPGNIFYLQEYVGGNPSGDRKEIARNLGKGVHKDIDINATNPWTGSRIFSIIMVLESGGVADMGMQIDKIKIGPEGQ